jgi:hypothetical protein
MLWHWSFRSYLVSLYFLVLPMCPVPLRTVRGKRSLLAIYSRLVALQLTQTCLTFWIVVFRVLTPSGLVGGYQRSGGTCRLHVQGWKNVLFSCRRCIVMRPWYLHLQWPVWSQRQQIFFFDTHVQRFRECSMNDGVLISERSICARRYWASLYEYLLNACF